MLLLLLVLLLLLGGLVLLSRQTLYLRVYGRHERGVILNVCPLREGLLGLPERLLRLPERAGRTKC